MAEPPQPGVPAVRGPDPNPTPRRPLRQSTLFGGLLVLVGAALLLGQFVHFDFGESGWPFFIIVPGLLLLVVALTSRGVIGEGLAIAGSTITITGLILLFQSATDDYQSWAYAWALAFPVAPGVGMILYGLVAGRPGNVRAGSRLVGIGLVIFLIGAAFFEGVIQISGYAFGQSAGVVLGAAIILLGAILLVVNLISSRRPAG
jgi:hypothetical protein